MRFKTGSEYVSNLVKEQCPEPSVMNSIRLQTYFVKTHNLWHQGLDFLKAQKNSHAYVFFMRFVNLVLALKKSHNAWNQKQYQRENKLNLKRLYAAVDKLEQLRPIIEEEYEKEIEKEKNKPKTPEPQEIEDNDDENDDEQTNYLNTNDGTNNNNNNTNNNSNNNTNKPDKSNLSSKDRWGNLLIPSAPPDPNNNISTNNNNNNSNFSNSSYNSNGGSMDNLFSPTNKQRIIVPTNLIPTFVNMVKSNTQKDCETCGVLTGKYNGKTDSYTITHCIIPKQHGTSNTVQMLHEEELIDIQEKYDIITLGWIHTHPSQTCFLSSVDLHCQLSYQIMMPNAIAIVHAPTDKTLVFSLTKKGIDILSKCDGMGFHRHEGQKGLYVTANHVSYDKNIKCTFVDVRNKR